MVESHDEDEEIVRAAYQTAEGDVLDLEDWRNAFTEDGVFNNIELIWRL